MQRVNMTVSGFVGQIPSEPHGLVDRITPIGKCIVLCHMGIPLLHESDWQLQIDGLARHQTTLKFPDLKRFTKFELESVHQCAGSPLRPRVPTQRVCNLVWGGARLQDVLDECGILPEAKFVWSAGADYGSFGGVECESFTKDMPIDRVGSDVLLAYEMNGQPLRPQNGYPVRLVVPGYYGTNSVKWLTRLTLAATRASSPFTTIWYNDPPENGEDAVHGATRPVWEIAPQSIIVSPVPNEALIRNEAVEIWGWAWSDAGARSVEVSVDGGASWVHAELEARSQRAWQRFSVRWTPRVRGRHGLLSRALGNDGQVQPWEGRRNAVFSIDVDVE